MAINLATKYSPRIAEAFSLQSVVDGKTNKDYEFTGVRSLHVYTPSTQGLNDYQRTGTSRYGIPTEMQDNDQELILTKDRSFSITIDKGNLTEQQDNKRAGLMLKAEINEQVIPEIDKYALTQFSDLAGTITAIAAPTKDTIVAALATGMTSMSNKKVPVDGRTIWIGWTNFGYLRQSNEFLGVDSLGEKVLSKGTLGLFMGAEVVPVPDDYLYKNTSQCYFLIAHKNGILQPKKIQDYFVKQDPPGINGALLEGRFLYDAFVIGSKADGIYSAIATGGQQAAPTASYNSVTKIMTLTSANATGFKYTLDGTDPRYSTSAKTISTVGSCTIDSNGNNADDKPYAGTTVTLKSAAYQATLFTSGLTITTQAI